MPNHLKDGLGILRIGVEHHFGEGVARLASEVFGSTVEDGVVNFNWQLRIWRKPLDLPMKRRGKAIPVAMPWIGEEELRGIKRVLLSRWLGQGPEVEEFERSFAKYIGTRFAVAVSSGTAALHLALLAHNIGSGDEVIVPTFTHIATANAVLYTGAKPTFVDIDPYTYNIDPIGVKKALTRRTKAMIPVHYAGQPAEIDRLMEIAAERGLILIEDAAEAHGATYKGRKVGSIGEAGCFSFAWNKNLTTGEGGMVTTNDESLARAVESLRNQGKAKVSQKGLHTRLGFNHKMTDIQAALGKVQLSKLERAIAHRVAKARYMSNRLRETRGIVPPVESSDVRHVYSMYTVRVRKREAGISRDALTKHLGRRGIDSRVYFIPVHLQPVFRTLYPAQSFPVAEEAANEVLTLPLYPELKTTEIDFMMRSIEAVVK
jgi:dTDP-4-amino-4,6-dideoxygalactose transaminase